MQDKVSDLLYHTTLTISHYREDTGGTTQTFYVLGTHSNLLSAKAFAKKALQSQGFETSDFPTYEVCQPEQPWMYGDGVLVYAKALSGEELLVGIDTKPNDEELVEGPGGTVLLPKGTTHLHYVVQTEINYNQSPDSRYHTHEIEGCFAHRAAAYEAARDCLAGEKDEFAQYDERQNLKQMPDVSKPTVAAFPKQVSFVTFCPPKYKKLTITTA